MSELTQASRSILVEDLIDAFVKRAQIAEPEGLLLIGSASRNETASRQDFDGQAELLSDLEFLAVVTDPRRRRDLQEAAVETTKLHDSPFFHVDVTTLLPSQFRRQRHRFWLWEAVAGGRIVAGHDFRPLLPVVRPETLDIAEANEILLWQFWRLFEHLNISEFNQHQARQDQCPSDDCAEMHQAAARAVLDVPTWTLATRGDLHVGFRARHLAFTRLAGVPEEVKDSCTWALQVRFEGAEGSCSASIERALRTLIWADDVRRAKPLQLRRMTDASPRNQLSNLRYFTQRRHLSVIPALPSLARPKARLMGRCRALAHQLLTHIVDGQPIPGRWQNDWFVARADAARTIGWIAKGDDR